MTFSISYLIYIITGIISTSLIMFIGIFLIVKSYSKTKNTTTLLFSSSFLMLGFWSFGSTLFPILPENYAVLLIDVSVISCYIALYALFLSLELINYDKVSLYRAVTFACVISVTSVFIIYDPSYLQVEYLIDFGGYSSRPSTLFSILQLIIVVGISTEFMITAFRIRKVAETPAQKQQANTFIIGAIVGLYGMIPASIIRWIINFPALMLLVASIGIVILGFAFQKDSNVAFVLPFRVQNLIVITAGGVNLFSRSSHSSENISEDLISGAISAISLLMQEALGTISNLEEVRFGDRYILLEVRENFVVFIIAYSTSTTLKIALKKFASYFDNKFKNTLNSVVDLKFYEQAEEGVVKYFGFLPGAWKSK